MTMIYALNHTTANHLAAVTAEMETLGAPTIRVVDCGDHYMALEGSHRLAAAHALGLEPVLEIYDQDEMIEIDGYDWYDACNWSCTIYPAGIVAHLLFIPSAAVDYRF
jgi:hypothetical protein